LLYVPDERGAVAVIVNTREFADPASRALDGVTPHVSRAPAAEGNMPHDALAVLLPDVTAVTTTPAGS
jgi:hypothetical protein